MAYSMRFFVDGTRPSGIAEIAAALKTIDPAFEIRGRELYRGVELLGKIQINDRGAGASDKIAEFLIHLDAVGGETAPLVKERLARASTTVAVELSWGKRGTETTLDLIAPLWQWLFEHHPGLLQADGEGFYDSEKLLLELA